MSAIIIITGLALKIGLGGVWGKAFVVLLANHGVVQWVERRRLVQALNDLSGREMLRG